MANIFSNMIQELRNGGKTDEQIRQMFDADIAVQGTVPPATPTPGQTGGTYEQNKFGDKAAEPLNLNQPVEQSQPTQKVNQPTEQPAKQTQPAPAPVEQSQPTQETKPVDAKRTLDNLYQDMQAKKKKYLEMNNMWKNTNYTAYTQQQMNDAYNEYKVAYEQYQAHYRDMKGKHSAGDKGEKQLSQATTPKNVQATDNALKEYQTTQTATQPQEPKVATIQEQATKNPGDWIYIGKGNTHADKNGWYQLKQGDIDWAKSKVQKA